MEKRINKLVESYLTTFKDRIREQAIQLGLTTQDNINNSSYVNKSIQLIQYIYDYERLVLNKDDFSKRKRVKNVVPFNDRCCAKRATNEQCTRRKKEGSCYCGTHLKGTPHGIVDLQNDTQPTTQKVEVWAQDIQGIIYYIDKFGNVYEAEEVILNKVDPKIIGKYSKNNNNYAINFI
jgi:hypothetical protein